MAEEQAGRRAGIVTLLFTDLVASTELLDRLGDEDFERLRRIHFQLLREAVAASGGEEVKNLGDGLMVVFPSALDAIGCAVAMQQAVAMHNAEPNVAPIAVRVGLHAGEPILEEDDYFGTPVVVAKRLCDRASGGQILVSDLVAALVGGRRQFSFRQVGAVELKGIGEPMATREVVWRDDDLAAYEITLAASASAPGGPPAVPGSAGGGPVPPPLPERPARLGSRWMLAGAGGVLAAGALAFVLMAGGGDDAPPTTTSASGATAPAPPATSSFGAKPASDVPSGAPRSFADGRPGEGDGFFLVDVVPIRREPHLLPLELREGEIITIRASAEQGSIQPFVELLGPEGAVVAFDVNAGGRGLPAIERWLVPAAGAYQVRISPLADAGRGEVQVIARTEDVLPTPEEPDAFAAVVTLGEERPEAAWMWDTGEEGQVKVRLQPHPDDPVIPRMQLTDGEGTTVQLDAAQMIGSELITLPHGGEWTIELAPTGANGSGMVSMQVWIAGTDHPDPEKLR